MKNTTPAPAADILDGDLEMPTLPHTGLTPGFKREPSFYENFLRFYNGLARCQLRKPFKRKINLARAIGESMEID
jgi:hypothetical protein